jgi:hypothetical protein
MTQVNLFFHALWILSGVGAVVFSANPASSRLTWLASGFLILGFAIGVAATGPDRVPDPVWIGGVAALLAALLLFKPRLGAVAAAYGGFLAAIWGVLMRVQGTPPAFALALAAAVPAVSAILTVRRPGFAPVHLREEALLVVLVLGVVVSMAPGAAAGWQAAVALNAESLTVPNDVASQMIPVWTIAATVAATLLGGAYALWMRR